jgi:hypothetical protein
MKDCTQDLLDLIPSPKAINARATFRVTRPTFGVNTIADNLPITDSTQIDSCAYGTGILRVTNYNNTLYTQEVPDVHLSTWPNWVSRGIGLMAGSRPGVDGGYVWYQKTASAVLHYRAQSNWSVEVEGRGDGDGNPEILAPIRNERCYSMYTFGNHIRFSLGVDAPSDTFWMTRPEYLYGVTQLRLDAVNYSNDANHPVDYVYFTDRDAGRIMEMRVVPTDDYAEWGQPRPIIAIDAIDEVYGLNLHGAEMIDGKVVVTGRLTRTSDGDPVSMDVYTFGPEDFSLGRDMFISGTNVGGKMMATSDELVVCGASYRATAVGTYIFGIDSEIYKLTSSDIEHVQLQEAENRSSTAVLSLSSSLSHIALCSGAHIEIEVAYNDEWVKVLTGEVSRVLRTRGNGEGLAVHIANLTAKRLSQWSPDQGIYVPSQAYTVCYAGDLSKIIRADGKFEEVGVSGYQLAGKYDDTHAAWVYSGTWGTDTPAGAYNTTIHYNNAANTTENASFNFAGTSFIFTYTKFTDRGLHDIWVDGVKIATVNAYNATKVQGQYVSPQFTPGPHTFKVTHGTPVSGYIDVDAIEIFGNGSAGSTESYLKPTRLNELAVLYTASRASRGGVMRARFHNEANIHADRNPRFGVGLNYRRESRVEAAARLGLEYTDVDDDMCGHNGIVAIYGRKEVNGSSGIKLYRWENSVLTQISQASVSLTLDSLVWLQIRFVEGAIRVSWRADTSSAWTTAMNFTYSDTSPWSGEDGGHGCVVMDRATPYTPCEGFGEAGGWAFVGVDDARIFTAGDETVMIDDEILTELVVLDKPSAHPDGITYGPFPYIENRFYSASGGQPGGDSTRTVTLKGTRPANSYCKASCIVSGGGKGHAFPNSNAFSNQALPTHWLPSNWKNDWKLHVGDTNYGSWTATPSDEWAVGAQYQDPAYRIFSDPRDTMDKDTQFVLKDGIYLENRGQMGTTAATHTEPTKVSKYYDIDLYVDEIEFYSHEEDITLADALRRVLVLAGGSITERYLVDTNVLTVSHSVLGSTWKVLDIDDGKKDFIAEIHIPKAVPVGQQVRIGVGFYGTIPLSSEFDEGYLLCVEDNALALYQMSGNTLVLVEKIYPGFTNRLFGVLRVSVQDNRFAVWLNHKLLHVFYRDTFSVEAYQYKGFVTHNPLGATLPPMRFLYSEMNDLMADIVIGTRGKGMSILGELTGNRRVYFRSEPDGSLFFYKTMSDVGNLPDIVISEQKEEVDELVSRVRVEGIKIAEIADFALLKDAGNLFETVNSMYAETVQDLVADGEKVIELIRQRSDVRSLETVFHPALQPGDTGVITIAGEETEIGVMASSVVFGFNGENFDVNAGLEVYVP